MPPATTCAARRRMSHGGNGHDYPTPPPSSERRVLGHAVTRIEDRPLVTGRGRYAGDINFPHQLHMRIVRSPKAHGKILSVDASAALKMPGVVAVWTNADIADLSPIDFRADKNATGIREFRQPALAKTYRALHRRSGGGGVRRRSLRRRGRRRAGRGRDRGLAGRRVGERSARRVRARPQQRSDRAASQLRRHRGGVPQRARRDRDRPPDRPPLRRAAGDARRHRRLRRGQGFAGAAWRGENPAPQSRDALPHAQARAVVAARAREPCRRRLRHPRRALSRGPAGAGRGDAVSASGEMDRGPARAPDVRQPGPRAAPPRAHRGRQGRPHPRHRGRDLPRPGRLYPHPRRERPEPHHVHDDRRLQSAGVSRKGARAAHQQDAGRDLSCARPLREHVRALAPDGRGRRQARPRSGRGAPAQSHHRGGIALRHRVQRAGRRGARIRFRRLPGPA